MRKVVRIGTARPTWTQKEFSVFCCIESDGTRLSITGVEGPMSSGNAWGSCGQIVDTIREHIAARALELAPGWSYAKLGYFLQIWDRWHLNDMRAGTPEQMQHLEGIKAEFPGYPVSHYEWAKERLAEAGLQPDPETGYSYGSAWLKEDVPEDVLEFLKGLPDTDKQPAWV
jgi:hypothetical protein